jgi:hypothetical protein
MRLTCHRSLDTDRSAFTGACDPHHVTAMAALIKLDTYVPSGTV